MPHDKKGNPLKVGDEVTLRARVTSVSEGETACNVVVEALDKPEGEEYVPSVSCNAGFFELATPPDNVRTDEELQQEGKAE